MLRQQHAQPDIRDPIFAKLIAGDIMGSLATSEPGASTDLSVKALRTEAVRVDGGYRLSGAKHWITNSPWPITCSFWPRSKAA